jgi:hypothetical protein
MKKLTIIFCLPLFLAACQNNSSESTTTTDSTTVIESTPADNTSGMATPGDTISATTTEASAGSNANSTSATGSNTSAAANATSKSGSGSSNINNTANRTPSPKDARTTLEKTGHYNSEISTPDPVNLDDKKFKKRKPQHTYGDTSIRAVPR